MAHGGEYTAARSAFVVRTIHRDELAVGGTTTGYDGALDHRLARFDAEVGGKLPDNLGTTGAAGIHSSSIEHSLGIALAAGVTARTAVGPGQDGHDLGQALVLLNSERARGDDQYDRTDQTDSGD